MSKCVYCGKPAGLLRKQHRECATRYQQGWSRMVSSAHQAIAGDADLAPLEGQLLQVASEHLVPAQHLREALVQAFDLTVGNFLEDGLLSEKEENRLVSFMEHFRLGQAELDRSGAYMKIAKAGVLRDLVNGLPPERLNIQGTLPFQLQKGEKLIWVFQNTHYFTERTRTHYEGRSAGVSLRIAKGVYYRTGAFRGHPVQTTYTSREATGALGVTTKHLYFAGGSKAFRIAHTKIVGLVPFSDGVGIQKEAVSAKPMIFQTGDGWFTYNLLSNVAQL